MAPASLAPPSPAPHNLKASSSSSSAEDSVKLAALRGLDTTIPTRMSAEGRLLHQGMADAEA